MAPWARSAHRHFGNISARLAKHSGLCALAMGALAACGFQPLALPGLTLVGVAGLIALVAQAAHGRASFALGWLWGFGHFALGLNWIATAFSYQAKMPVWLGWLGVALVAAACAVFPALAAAGAWLAALRLQRMPTPAPPAGGRGFSAALVLSFAACWIIAEWLRGWVLTGFAWNPLAAVALGAFNRPGLAALAPWLGTYGLSGLMVVLAGCWWAAAARARLDGRAVLLVAGPVLLLMQPGAYGPRDAPGRLRYTLVQPNIDQAVLDDPAHYEAQFIQTAQLSLPLPPGERRIVLWPESGDPDYLRAGYPAWAYRATTFAGDPAAARARIARVIGPGALLLTGTVDLSVQRDAVTGAANVVTAVDGDGRIAGGYAKAHLVPFGEYLPLRGLFTPLGLARLVPGDIDFQPGAGPRMLPLGPWGKAGIDICYEIIFSGAVTERGQRPDYIFNPSNDGWFGSWGPPQHLAQARLRAIEEGLPVLRSTTNGISAVVDANGVVRGFVPRGAAGRLDGLVPPAHPPTWFARLGNILPLGWAMVLLVAGVVARRQGRR